MKVRNMVLVALYRVESRVGITPGEARALLFVALLLVGGVSVQYAVDIARTLPADSPVQIVWPSGLPGEGDAARSALDSLGSDKDEGIASMRNAPSGAPGDALREVRRVGINTASSEELQRLPGIGPAIADRIVEYRARYGLFQSVEELTAVKGIGPKTLAKLEPQIVLNADDR